MKKAICTIRLIYLAYLEKKLKKLSIKKFNLVNKIVNVSKKDSTIDIPPDIPAHFPLFFMNDEDYSED